MGTGATAREYLGIRPVGFRSAVRLYSCYGSALLHRMVDPERFRGAGRYLGGGSPITVRTQGLRMRARPRSEDLGYLLPGHKRSVWRWFRPGPEDRVMDVGAHVGLFSLLAARQGARVLALEPNPATAEILRENLRLNGFSDAQVRSVAAGERDGVGVLEVPEIYDGRASIVPGWASGAEGTPFRRIEVPIRTIDQEFSGSGFDRIDWLLIDVEGSELQALRGARKTLDRTRRVILEVARGPWREECRRILEADHDLRIRSVEPQSPVTEYWLAERPA